MHVSRHGSFGLKALHEAAQGSQEAADCAIAKHQRLQAWQLLLCTIDRRTLTFTSVNLLVELKLCRQTYADRVFALIANPAGSLSCRPSTNPFHQRSVPGSFLRTSVLKSPCRHALRSLSSVLSFIEACFVRYRPQDVFAQKGAAETRRFRNSMSMAQVSIGGKAVLVPVNTIGDLAQGVGAISTTLQPWRSLESGEILASG